MEEKATGTKAAHSVKNATRWQLAILLVVCLAVWRLFAQLTMPAEILAVRGNQRVSVQEIQRAAGLQDGGWLLLLRPAKVQQNILRDARIKAVSVQWTFPLTLEAQVEERLPVALLAGRFGFVELDAAGVVVATHRSLRNPTVPLVTGVTAAEEYIGDSIRSEDVMAVLAFLAGLDNATLAQLSEINVRQPERVLAISRQSFQIRLGSIDQLPDKTATLGLILKDVLQNKAPIDYIDISYAVPTVKFKH